MSVAAIDCGTNSTRLLITDGTHTLDRRNRITRLGKGVDATGRLDPEAIQRTVDVLAEYRRAMDEHGVTQVRMSATSAARDSANRDEFFDAAERVIGVKPELLSGTDEGTLSFQGATADLGAGDEMLLVVDIGGGSTELIVGRTEPLGVYSMDVGCVRLTEKFLHHDPPQAEELADVLNEVRETIETAVIAVPALRDATRMIGVAGTITTVAAVEQGLAVYDRDKVHHFWLTRAAAEDVFRTLATEKRADRIHNPGLEEARADVIVAGCAVLVSVLRFFDLPGCLVSESDILDGLAASIL